MSENTTTYSFGIPAGATILRVVETNGVHSVEVRIPMKDMTQEITGAAIMASYRRPFEEEHRKNREASAAVTAFNRIKPIVDALDKRLPLAFTLWPEPVIFGMDLGAADESVEGIVATPDSRSDRAVFGFDGSQPKGDVVDAEFDPGAEQQDPPNPERPNPITAEWFKASVGTSPIDDDLDRCNCRRADSFGHVACGWDDARDMPNFVPGPSKRTEALLARIAVLEGLLHQAKGFLPINSGMLADIEAALA